MKKTLITLLILGFGSTALAQKLSLSNSNPEANKPLEITYDPAGGKLSNQTAIKIKAFTFVDNVQNQMDIEMKKEGQVFKGTFTPNENTALALFNVSSGAIKDDNPKGYYTVFYKEGKPVPYAYYWEAMLYNGMGKSYAGIENDKAKALQILEKGIQEYTIVKDKYFPFYISLVVSQDKIKATNLGMKEIDLRNQKKQKSEEDWSVITGVFNSLKMTAQVDSVAKLWVAQYPKGDFAFTKAYESLYKESDIAKKEILLKKMEIDFGFNDPKSKNHSRADDIYFLMAEVYTEANDQGKLKAVINKIQNKQSKAQALNTYAWAAAEKKQDIAFATELSKESLGLIEQAKAEINPSQKNTEALKRGLDQNYAMFADTYALLLSFAGNFNEALKYQEIAVLNNNYADIDMNGRYVNFLAKAGKAVQAREFGERFVKDGAGSEQLKADLKSVYQGSLNFEDYYAKLEAVAFEKEVEKYKVEMLDRIAPSFSLKNLEGQTVSLASLKGKVVIIDYWATWCGPCVASFPGMQKAVDKYKDDPNVAFVFINTWQNESNREEVVKNFMKANPYRFNVLLDTKKPNDPSKFEVIDQYGVEGIPTKFILDGNGKIRFKKVGFNGSTEGTVRELDVLIKLAKEAGTK